jgi:hypothetical protein
LSSTSAAGSDDTLPDEALDRLNERYLSQLRQTIEQYAQQRQPLPNPGPLKQVRANLHVHSEFSHDSQGKIEAIVAAAKRAGTEVLLFTEHPAAEYDFFVDGHSGLRDGVLLIPGAEMKGLLVFPTLSLHPFEGAESAELTQIVRTRGGHVFLSHLEERMDWNIPGLTGVEIYNTHADFKQQRRLLEAMRNPLWFVKTASLVQQFPQEVFASLQNYPADYLRRWDELCQHAPHTGIAANDAHENVGIRLLLGADQQVIVTDALGEELLKVNRLLVSPFIEIPADAAEGSELFRLILDPYENSLRHAGTHLLVSELTREAVWEALEAGRAFVAFDWLADSSGFDLALMQQDTANTARRWELGSQLNWSNGLTLVGQAPLPARWRVMRSGECIAESEGSMLSAKVEQPGVYRVELWLAVDGTPKVWILSNPFYVAP